MASAELKRALRAEMRQALRQLSHEALVQQSTAVTANLLATEAYRACSAVSVYLAMPREVDTDIIIQVRAQKGALFI